MPAFAAAIFDMDGLLIDSERVLMRLWTAEAARHGCALAPEAYVACIGRAAAQSDAILAGLMGSAERMRAVREAVGVALRDVASNAFPLRPGVRRVLAALSQHGVRRAVASSSRLEEIRHRLIAVDVHRHFAAFAGGDEVAFAKPDPAVYRLAAERLGVDPARCLAFEDSVPGATAALAAGMQVVVVPDLKPPTDEIRSRSLAVLDSLEDALPHLPRWFGDPHPPGRPQAPDGFLR